ncbi:hypothetical protein [Clostridium baratii]|uniref:hypothetical protein n=1 Tax=Clostridium baratii TaxID=1561 RepID=UPI0005F27E63|nr:hypothetical protein [Clostridium baratii]AQM58585.1 hypothetical protein NPD11_3042 [Clostridium baratii]KJU71558.1 hypothetical protein UC77_09090 [Clostridium baratii]
MCEDLFKMFENDEAIKEFNKENEKIVSKKAKDTKTKDTKINSKNNSAKENANKTKTKTKEEQIQENCKKYTEIILKAFTEQITSFKGEEINEIDLIKIQDDLVNIYGFGEFINGVKWQLVPNKDKTIGYLIATYNFYNKG